MTQVEELLKNIATINWIMGMALMLFSNAGLDINPHEVEKKGWHKYRMGYSVKEIKSVIDKSSDLERNKKLKRKILFRRLYPIFLISTIVLIIIVNR